MVTAVLFCVPCRQVCEALQAMHSMEPALAHRDVKAHNVLLHRRVSGLQWEQQQDDTGHRRLHLDGSSSSRGPGMRGSDHGPPYAALPPVGAMDAEDMGAGLELQQMQSSAVASLADASDEGLSGAGCGDELARG